MSAGPAGRTNYGGNEGSGRPIRVASEHNGVFTMADWGRPFYVGLHEVRDGLSHTAMLSEWLVPAPAPTRRRQGLQLRDQGEHLTLEQFRGRCASVAAPGFGIGRGQSWHTGAYYETLYNHGMTIISPTCVYLSMQGSYTLLSPASDHPGGANMAFCDGRVSFVREGVSVAVIEALGTRNGGEIVSTDDL